MTRTRSAPLTDHVPLDRDGIVDGWFERLEPAPSGEIRRLADEMVRSCNTHDAVVCYAQEMAAYLGWCNRHGVDPLVACEDDAFAYAASLTRYAQGTQHLKLMVVRRMYAKAVNRKLIAANPFAGITLPSRLPETNTPALTRAQVEMLLGAIAASFDDPRRGLTAKRDYTLITLMVRLALRSSEASGLHWGRFQDHDGRIRSSFIGKGNKPAHLDLPDDVWQTLLRWKRAYERASGVTLNRADPVFPPCDTRALKAARARVGLQPLAAIARRSVHNMVVARLADVGLEQDRLAPHALRATGAVLAFRAGASIIEIKELLRHSSVDTTMRYLQALVGGAARAAIDRIQLDVPRWTDPDDDPPQDDPPGGVPTPPDQPAIPGAPWAEAARQRDGGAPAIRPSDTRSLPAATTRGRQLPPGSLIRDARRWTAVPLAEPARAYLAALPVDRPANVSRIHRLVGRPANVVWAAETELAAAGLISFSSTRRRVERTPAGIAVDVPIAPDGALSEVARRVLAELPTGGATRWGHRVRADLGLDVETFAAAVRELRGTGLVRTGRGGSVARILGAGGASAAPPGSEAEPRPEAA